jgi:DNA-binding NarL/FixJ family response regulator
MDDLVAALQSRTPAVLLLSIDLPGLAGIEGVRRLRTISPATKIIVLARETDEREELELLRAGVRGYCAHLDSHVLLKMIEKVQQGEVWAGRRTIGALLDQFYDASAASDDAEPGEETLRRLTSREREILDLLARGASNKEIAVALNVTVATVKAHLTKMFRKLGQPDRLHLALFAAAQRRAYQ